MKKSILAGVLFAALQCMNGQVNSKLQAYIKDISYNKQNQPSFITLKATPQVKEADVQDFINSAVLGGSQNKVVTFKTEKDNYGFTTTKYTIAQNGVTIYNKIIIAHCKDGRLVSLNGDLVAYKPAGNGFTISEKDALANALKKVNAKKYKWENKEEEASMAKIFNKPNFSYYPTGAKVVFEAKGEVRMAYQFNIYAEQPLYRAYVFVDATTGKILGEQNLICHTNVSGSATTMYSGTHTIVSDQVSANSYRLRETTRGLGVETYNLSTGTNYGLYTDFTNTSANWNITGIDKAAEDAHWGAESTYDFYYNKFNINSIDNAGYKLVSYVHYDTQYDNAFWNGQFMTYGDGDGNQYNIFTALDICGHEITHGLVSNTAMLGSPGYNQESDALNEGFADIFGTSIERYARPTNWNWIIGLDIDFYNQGLRNMSNPPSLGQPDTYLGNNWDSNGEPHQNNGPCIYWFYLLTAGGSGTNDNGDSYNITGLGNVSAEKIAYRALTTYFTPNTTYADARLAAIQAATDLFGLCSNELEQTANAWHAVGVGNAYSNSVIGPNFVADNTSFCAIPATANFSNTTSNGTIYSWDFGDGSTSTSTNTSHSYQANGTYNVKLKATGCSSAQDSIIKTAYIVVDTPDLPSATSAVICGPGQAVLTASGNDVLTWYNSPSASAPLAIGGTFNTPTISATTTFYVVNMTSNASIIGGLASIGIGSFWPSTSESLIFDVVQNSILNSVVVYAQQAGSEVIEMRDTFGNLLNSSQVSVSVGSNTVTLNFALTPGSGYQLGLNALSTSTLFRTNTGVNYPYLIGGSVNITGSTSGSGFYYGFYKWKVTRQNCGSTPVAVTASVNPLPAVAISGLSADSVCNSSPVIALTGSPAGGTFSGSGITGSSFDPAAAGIGDQSIAYSYTDGNGCTNVANVAMVVNVCTGISNLSLNETSLKIYPNPFTDHIIIKSDFSGPASITITDATGKLILSKTISSGEENLNMANLAQGLYEVHIQDGSSQPVKTMKLVKE